MMMDGAGLPDRGSRRGRRRRVTERAATVATNAHGRGGEAPLPSAIYPAPNIDRVVEAGFIESHRRPPLLKAGARAISQRYLYIERMGPNSEPSPAGCARHHSVRLPLIWRRCFFLANP